MFAKTFSGNDKGVCKQIFMASVLDDSMSQTTDTNKEIMSSLQKFIMASNKNGGNIYPYPCFTGKRSCHM